MKRLTSEEWEKRYIVGETERFDQKNTMFNRPGWDTQINGLLKSWSFTGEVKEKPGFTLEDQALRWACRRGTMMTLFNIYKPNPSRAAKAVAELMPGSNPGGMASAAYKPPEGARVDTSDPAALTQKIKKAATFFGADMVGVCRLDRRWVYSHTYNQQPYTGPGSRLAEGQSIPQEIPEAYQHGVIMAFEQDYHMLRHIPGYIASAATSMGYSRLAITSNYLTAFVRNLGFQAIDCSVNDVALSIPMAMQAGLGDISRMGLLITPPFGPRVRLTMVITDLPLVPDPPIDFGVIEFCRVCKKCVHTCPTQAIPPDEPTEQPWNISNAGGQLKWRIDAEKCRMGWSRLNRPCTICVSVCPFNKLDTWPHKVVRWFIDHVRWADPLYVRGDDLLGYGKPKKADRFWEEWRPGRN